jgi:hypothetical protein
MRIVPPGQSRQARQTLPADLVALIPRFQVCEAGTRLLLELPGCVRQHRETSKDGGMANLATAPWNLGFLTVVQEPAGYLGGYLVTNQWGRPLEFRLSTAVLPNRVQQILYGDTLQPYICAELIGKTLIDKTITQAQVIVTDRETVLPLRQLLPIPVGWIHGSEAAPEHSNPFQTHSQFPQDQQTFADLESRLGDGFDLAEPFARIREAIGEARKMGVTSRG